MNATSLIYDAIIIGGGPTGLSAAIYTAREGMKTAVVDKGAFGGMAAITETIENYPGFAQGVGGPELIKQMSDQAERFGAEAKPFTGVTGIAEHNGLVTVQTENGELVARSVLIATGSTYRQLDAPGEAELIGRGVHFCATCDGPLYKGKRLTVVGGGNSALQETLFLARFASEITILVRGAELKASDVLQREIAELQNVSIVFNAAIDSFDRRTSNESIILSATIDGVQQRLETDGVFVFIGLLPNNNGLEGLTQDERGFIKSDAHLATKVAGVFVAGDIRSGSTWQIASAVGEGVSAALRMREFLDTKHPGWHKKG